jgi:hypothetical protein
MELANTQTYGTADKFAALFAYLRMPLSGAQCL